MVSRTTVVASLVVVVLLAGCSGLVGDAGTPDSPDDVDLSSGYAADGVTDDEQAAQSYRNALGNTSSYSIDYTQNLSGEDSDVSYIVTYRVDGDGEEAYHSVAVPAQDYEVESYYDGDQQVTREASAGGEQVSTQEGGVDENDLTAAGAISPLLSNSTEYETSVDQRDGTTVVVYETSGADSAESVFGVDAGNVTAFSAEFSVDADGVVRHASYELTYAAENGEEQTLTLSFELSDVDETTVERPEWANDS